MFAESPMSPAQSNALAALRNYAEVRADASLAAMIQQLEQADAGEGGGRAPESGPRERVNGWLRAISSDPAGEDVKLDADGLATISLTDGAQLFLRLGGEVLSFYHMLLEAPEESAAGLFQAALLLNLNPDAVGAGHLAYEQSSGALAYCAHLPLEMLTQERFAAVLAHLFDGAEGLRGNLSAMMGAPQAAVGE